MTLLPVLIAMLLGILTLALVLYPLYRHAQPEVVQQRAFDGIATTQVEIEQTARTALKEIELDYQLGNLAAPDYRSLRDRYTRRAFTARKSRQRSEEGLDAMIEERLQMLKEEGEFTPDESEPTIGQQVDATERDDDTD